MPSSWTDGARASGPVLFSFWPVTLLLVVVMLGGCVTTQERGDRAFEAQQYNEALDHYERVIDSGSTDPELYYRAAKAAVRVGDFALAERYYSRALRHGGDEEVVRSLAEFYVATSNYTKAVRVLQQLLERTDDPQSVFNNLGTALMYADAPIDAESYLLIAQQMDPNDPVPYLNLGVLYDKHLNQPQQALGFYKCFLELSQNSNQRRKINTRVEIYEKRYEGKHQERYEVECGQPYQGPRALSDDEMRDKLEALKEERADAESASDATDQPDATDEPDATDAPDATDEKAPSEAGEDGEADDDEPHPVIRRHGQTSAESGDAEGDSKSPADSGESQSEDPVELAQKAFEAQNHEEAVKHLQQVPIDELDARAMALYGRALMALDEHARAQRWLAGAVEEDPSPDNVEALLEVYLELKSDEKIARLCRRFAGEPELEDILARCPQNRMRRQLEDE